MCIRDSLTVKSDDVTGRVRTYEAIVTGENIPEPGVPESFKVLMKELQSLALDVRVYGENHQEIQILSLIHIWTSTRPKRRPRRSPRPTAARPWPLSAM